MKINTLILFSFITVAFAMTPVPPKQCSIVTSGTHWTKVSVRVKPCNNVKYIDVLYEGDTVYSTGKERYGCNYYYTLVYDPMVNRMGWVGSMFLDCSENQPGYGNDNGLTQG